MTHPHLTRAAAESLREIEEKQASFKPYASRHPLVLLAVAAQGFTSGAFVVAAALAAWQIFWFGVLGLAANGIAWHAAIGVGVLCSVAWIAQWLMIPAHYRRDQVRYKATFLSKKEREWVMERPNG